MWNYLDILAFGTTFCVKLLWIYGFGGIKQDKDFTISNSTYEDVSYTGSNENPDQGTMRFLMASSVLMLVFKILYFARGFAAWSHLVRMINQIFFEMIAFLGRGVQW